MANAVWLCSRRVIQFSSRNTSVPAKKTLPGKRCKTSSASLTAASTGSDLNGQCRVVVQQARHPVFLAEHQRAREKDAAGETLQNIIGQFDGRLDRIGAVGGIADRRHVVRP